MKTRSIKNKLMIYIGLLMLVCALAIGLFVQIEETNSLIKSEEKRAITLAENLAGISAHLFLNYNFTSLQRIADEVTGEGEILYVVFYTKEGLIAAASGAPELVRTFPENSEEARLLSSNEISLRQLGETFFPHDFSQVLEVIHPVTLKGETARWGTVQLGLSLRNLNSKLTKTKFSILGIAFFFVLIGITAAVFIGKNISSPLEELLRGTREAAKGRFDRRVKVDSRDEFEELGKSFNKMLEELDEKETKLQAFTKDLEHLVEEKTGELRDSEERYRKLVEYSPDAIFLHDDSNISYANSAAVKLLGVDSETNLLGRSLTDFMVKERRDIVRERIFRIQKKYDAVFFMEEKLIQVDGTSIDAEISVIPLKHEDSRSVQIVVRDVTERKLAESERRKIEERIQHTQKLESLESLAAGIAHDFNNLLMIILGNANLLKLEAADDRVIHGYIDTIEKATVRASELTDQMLAYSGKRIVITQPVNLTRLVKETGDLLKSVISKKIELNFDLAEDLPLINGDPAQLNQIIMNIVTNASEAIGDKDGIIAVRTDTFEADRDYLAGAYISEELTEGIYVCLEVKDTGAGMDPETKSRIFDPFFSTKFVGRGLGLAAAIGIVRAHEGAIIIESEPDKGTNLRVLFPPAAEEAIELPELEPERKEYAELKGKGTILVVDDEESVLQVAEAMLTKSGFDVLTAEDGLEAVKIFRRKHEQIDLVLLDLAMPRMNGEEAFRELKDIRNDIRVILSSGYSEDETVSRFTEQKLAGFIHKPYNFEELIRKVLDSLES